MWCGVEHVLDCESPGLTAVTACTYPFDQSGQVVGASGLKLLREEVAGPSGGGEEVLRGVVAEVAVVVGGREEEVVLDGAEEEVLESALVGGVFGPAVGSEEAEFLEACVERETDNA